MFEYNIIKEIKYFFILIDFVYLYTPYLYTFFYITYSRYIWVFSVNIRVMFMDFYSLAVSATV